METVIHEKFGKGEVVNREVKATGTYITVRFACGKEMLMAIPASFEKGGVKALGTLKEEVDKAIADKRAREEKLKTEKESAVAVKSNTTVVTVGVKKRWIPSCSLSRAYERYLIDNGYKVESDSGNPSTVYSYGNAVDKIVELEGLTWDSLASNINDIVDTYGEGGSKWDIGRKSNGTYINALRRFKEMVNP